MKLIFLGTAGAVPRPERDNTSLLLEFKEDYFLIDTPGALVYKLKNLNIDYFKINHVFLSHSHPDHIYGLPAFIHTRMFDNSCIYIYGHRNCLKIAYRLLGIFKLKRRIFPKVRFIRLKDKSQCEIFKDFKIKTFKVNHNPDSLGIKIKVDNKIVVFSSDTSLSQNLIGEAKDADYLIHDCFAPQRFFEKYPELNKMHTSTQTLAKIAREINPKILIPIHFSGELEFQIEEIKNELDKYSFKNIYLPKDLEEILL